MFAYFKSEPTEYILAYSNGKIAQQGAGLAFWYWRPSTSIVLVPISTVDAPFVFNETTGNFQAVTLQGQITYRIIEPETISRLLNFTPDHAANSRHQSRSQAHRWHPDPVHLRGNRSLA
ncbi:MAG TPA: SPFH domain-containing protein [Ktedonobacteraceae bacterium]|nr:SPFH domain-containing protein [Ktedonobacteraceae bacterium]